MRISQLFCTLLTLSLLSVPAHAEMHEHHHDMAQPAMSHEQAATHQGTGVLKAVNAKAHKVQIAHEAIPGLDWPPMVMWFALQGELPQDLKMGDKVQFELQQVDGKKWGISHIEKH